MKLDKYPNFESIYYISPLQTIVQKAQDAKKEFMVISKKATILMFMNNKVLEIINS